MQRCEHFNHLPKVKPKTPEGCEECLKIGDEWVHLRLCLNCGHVGCCDQSKNKHATRHFRATHHAAMKSFQPEDHWSWCYVHEEMYPDAD